MLLELSRVVVAPAVVITVTFFVLLLLLFLLAHVYSAVDGDVALVLALCFCCLDMLVAWAGITFL